MSRHPILILIYKASGGATWLPGEGVAGFMTGWEVRGLEEALRCHNFWVPILYPPACYKAYLRVGMSESLYLATSFVPVRQSVVLQIPGGGGTFFLPSGVWIISSHDVAILPEAQPGCLLSSPSILLLAACLLTHH